MPKTIFKKRKDEIINIFNILKTKSGLKNTDLLVSVSTACDVSRNFIKITK